jgi:hypothetical protein
MKISSQNVKTAMVNLTAENKFVAAPATRKLMHRLTFLPAGHFHRAATPAIPNWIKISKFSPRNTLIYIAQHVTIQDMDTNQIALNATNLMWGKFQEHATSYI